MENQAQRLRDLRAELRTVEELLDMAENDAQRRQYLLEKMSVQRQINSIHSGGDGAVNRGKNSDAYVGPPAAQPMSQGPPYQHPYGSEPGRSQYYGGPQIPAAPAMSSDRGHATHVHGGSQHYPTPAASDSRYDAGAVDPGRRRTMNSLSAADAPNSATVFQTHENQQPTPQSQDIFAASPDHPESFDDEEYHPAARTDRPPRASFTPHTATTPIPTHRYKRVKPEVPLYPLIVRDESSSVPSAIAPVPVLHGSAHSRCFPESRGSKRMSLGATTRLSPSMPTTSWPMEPDAS